MKVLTRPEELALLAVWRLHPDAYGVTIRQYVMDVTETRWSVGAIYDALDRLSLRGLLQARQADPTPERGGRSKKYFKLTRLGHETLMQMREMQMALWRGLPAVDFE